MMSDDPEEPGNSPNPSNSLDKMALTGPPPASPQLTKLVERYVGRAKLKFRDFRADREKIEHMLVEAAKRDELSKDEAALVFLDAGDIVSLPLAQRYIEMREFELIAKHLRSRLYYVGQTWLTARNRMILDEMIAGGEPAMAVALLRKYLSKVREYTQERWRDAGRKASPGDTDPERKEQLKRSYRESLRDLPANLEIAELELAEIEAYISVHGSREDNRALEKFRDEIAKVRKRFNLA